MEGAGSNLSTTRLTETSQRRSPLLAAQLLLASWLRHRQEQALTILRTRQLQIGYSHVCSAQVGRGCSRQGAILYHAVSRGMSLYQHASTYKPRLPCNLCTLTVLASQCLFPAAEQARRRRRYRRFVWITHTHRHAKSAAQLVEELRSGPNKQACGYWSRSWQVRELVQFCGSVPILLCVPLEILVQPTCLSPALQFDPVQQCTQLRSPTVLS